MTNFLIYLPNCYFYVDSAYYESCDRTFNLCSPVQMVRTGTSACRRWRGTIFLMAQSIITHALRDVDSAPNPPDGARFRLRPIYQAVPNPTAIKLDKLDRRGKWHGQVGQDRTVNALMPSKATARRRRFFIDLAANEWRFLSNTRALERDYAWEGLCIEASPRYHADLLSRRNCTVVAVAVASTEDTVQFAASRKAFGGIVGPGMDNEQATSTSEMRTIPFSRILDELKAPKTIDYLSLDVEGAESLVMSSFPWDSYTISVLTVERPKPDLVQMLQAHGYVWQCNHGKFGDELWLSRKALESQHVQNVLARGIQGCCKHRSRSYTEYRRCAQSTQNKTNTFASCTACP